jgi:RNA-directed DNA polymerase
MPLSIPRLVQRKQYMPLARKTKHPWYKIKGYLHFDFALTKAEAEQYVCNSANILRHRFSPLIHYIKKSRKVQRNIEAERDFKRGLLDKKPKLRIKEKDRNIFYTSHIDGYIYSFYGHKLQASYDDYIKENALSDNVIAYRAIEKKGIKYCNTHFANEAFSFVRSSGGCNIACFDLSKFFDKLSTEVLKQNWQKILGVERLPDDHFAIYQSLANFRYVEESALLKMFSSRFGDNPRKHGIPKESGGSLKNRICDYKELRDAEKSARLESEILINPKSNLEITGIAQGTALSGLMSNIFMINFDIAAKEFIKNLGGCYKRYSDDILIAFPSSVPFSDIEKKVTELLAVHCLDSVKLNADKTEKKIYQIGADGQGSIIDAEKLTISKVQYLGFHFDGKNVHIRNSSISKDRAKTIQLISKSKKGNKTIDTRNVYKKRSHRKITPVNELQDKGFVSYATRAAEAHEGAPGILKQMQKNDRFIKRAIKRARPRNSSASVPH